MQILPIGRVASGSVAGRQAGGRQEPGRSQAGVQAGGRHEPCSGLVEPGQEVQVGAVGGPQKGCVHW